MKPAVTLDNLRIATPCPVGWESMSGTDQVRFCEQCRLNVYNISELSRREAEQLIASTEGGICGRIYRRADGTVITRDCPVGLRAMRRRISKTAAAVFALVGSLSGLVVGQAQSKRFKSGFGDQTRTTRKHIESNSSSVELTGLVLEANGAVVVGAKVKLSNGTYDLHQTESNDEGKFSFSGVAPGRYSVNIESPGFEPFALKSLKLEKNEAIDIEVTLSVAVNVTVITMGYLSSEPSLIDISKPSRTTIIGGELLRRHPLQ